MQIGYATNWTTYVVIEMEGLRRENSMLMAHAIVVRSIPMTHALTVLHGISLDSSVYGVPNRCFSWA
jgi:hypothetical protein